MNKYSVPYITLVRSQCQSSTYYSPVRNACGPSGLRLAWYIRLIRFEIRFEQKKTIRRSLLLSILVLGYSRRQSGLQKAMREKQHWLRITDRINYKLCLLVYKTLHGQAPEYLQELCIPASSDIHRTRLRSAHRGDLIIPCVNLSKYGQRSFAYVAPHIWISLPQQLKDCSISLNVFKRKLKTHFFIYEQHVIVHVELACIDNVAILLLLVSPLLQLRCEMHHHRLHCQTVPTPPTEQLSLDNPAT